jgi:hypothetical protein
MKSRISIFCMLFCLVYVNLKAQSGKFYNPKVLYVKMLDDSGYEVKGKQIFNAHKATDQALNTLSELGWWSKVHQVSDKQLEEWRRKAEYNLNEQLPDLRAEFHFHLYNTGKLNEAKTMLLKLKDVQEVLGVPLPVKPPVPDFLPQQHYLKTNDIGINADSVWQIYNIRGAGIKLCDVEYSFNKNHEDLPVVTIIGNTPVDPFDDSLGSHGTAVLGQIISLNNDWGTTGGASDCQPYFASAFTAEDGYNPSLPITNALTVLGAGDVLLLEQQTGGPNMDTITPETQRGLVPIEWYKPSYNAIKLAVGQGVTVVEAAGNGAENLDAPEYSTGNNEHYPFLAANNSGAIIVGAGGTGATMGGVENARARLYFSNYGSRVDLQGNGETVTTTSYGDLYSAEGVNKIYTTSFGGTSGASPIVTSAAILLQSTYKSQRNGAILTPAQVRSILKETGKLQLNGTYPVTHHIGPLPNAYAAIIQALNSNTGVNELAGSQQPILCPNPNNGKFILQLPVTSGNTIQVCNVGGSVLKQYDAKRGAQNIELNITDQPDGIYFVRVVNDKGASVQRLILAK